MLKKYWRELLIVTLFIALGFTRNQYSEVLEISTSQEKTISNLVQKLKQSNKQTDSYEEIRPDGTVVKHIVIVESKTESETSTSTKRELAYYKELLKKSKSQYQWGWAVPLADAIKFRKMSFDAGIRVFDLPVFGIVQYTQGNVLGGIRLEW